MKPRLPKPRLLVCALLASTSSSLLSQVSLDKLSIEVRGTSREFAFTNKESAFLYGETSGPNTTSWQGFNVFGHEFLDDYALIVDGKELSRGSALRTTVYPDYLERTYRGGVTEEVRIVDSLALFAVVISSPKPVDLVVIPLFTDGRKAQDFRVTLSDATALVARTNHQTRTEQENYPVYLAVHGRTCTPLSKDERRGTQYSPVQFVSAKGKRHVIAFAVGNLSPETEMLARQYEANAGQYAAARRARMEKLLGETDVETDNKRFDKALAWAKLSLDALIMNQVTKGIFAGLPWFNNYWGRDTFISLPGAALVTGRFDEAKQILRSFAAFQQIDSTSPDEGRIPNIVTTTDKAYNTADGTPRFVMMARDYIERSGDTTFIYEIYPTVIRSIEGTFKHHTDSLGFLTHGDAETWMDAVGPDGPWSPRGNRANDIQALWAQQLRSGIWFAARVGDAVSAGRWNDALHRLQQNFTAHFISDGIVADHLNADGSPDSQLRPNQIFASPLLDDLTRARVTKTVTTELTYEYGVASLSQNDDNFHPYHQYEPFYPKDAAYHNGTVWTWLQGPLISQLCLFSRHETAWKITSNSVHQILDRGAVGTQSELLDAVHRPGEKEPRLSGTFSQAWNLAEFIRNFYDDYLGVRVARLEHELVLRPMLPKALGNVRAIINLNGRGIPISIEQRGGSHLIRINAQNLRVGGRTTIEIPTGPGSAIEATFRLPPKNEAKIELRGNDVTLWLNDNKQNCLTKQISRDNYDSLFHGMALSEPRVIPGLRAIKGPDYPTLTNPQVKADSRNANLLLEASDPEGDDHGPGARGSSTGVYAYPRNANFIPGSFDITRFTVRSDDRNAYFELIFRALPNPGWHPEYGFQLTYAAIAIDEDGRPGSGQRRVPHNANFTLDERHAYEKLILIGGGVRLEDSRGKTVVAYIPTAPDAANPLGNAETGTISFALPLSYLGKPTTQWTLTVLAGAQDDHGGAGLGEFRTINREVGEWNGGGKLNPDDPNVYDVLVVQPR